MVYFHQFYYLMARTTQRQQSKRNNHELLFSPPIFLLPLSFPSSFSLYFYPVPIKVMDPDFPSRPKFCWTVKDTPWTDGRGNQEDYVNDVKLWKAIHDKLPSTNGNKNSSRLAKNNVTITIVRKGSRYCQKNCTLIPYKGPMVLLKLRRLFTRMILLPSFMMCSIKS